MIDKITVVYAPKLTYMRSAAVEERHTPPRTRLGLG